MERMTRDDLADWARGADQETVLWERRNAAEALTLMDERDACARRLAAATAALESVGLALRHLVEVLHWDDDQDVYMTPYWYTQTDHRDAERAVERWKTAMNEAADPHGPGAARGA